jgi:hypothetical protein
MAIVQISRIQHRRGLQQDLPQLASAELGWSIDTRRLYIGNGSLTEGAPIEGITEILTSQSNFLEFVNTYTFKGTEAGYTSVTGVTQLSPILRSIQGKLDEVVSVRDFGATGNGVTDDTAAIQRAISQIYVSDLNGTVPSLRRTIKIPAGTYFISSPISVPPNCVIVGDGKNSTILSSRFGTVFITADSKYNTGAGLGTANAVLPSNISISKLTVSKTANTIYPVVMVDSTVNISFDDVVFIGDRFVERLVELASSLNPCNAVTFNRCVFTGGINGVRAVGLTNQPSTNVNVLNSVFSGQTGTAVVTDLNLVGFVSLGNEFGSVAPFSGLYGDNYSVGDHASATAPGIRMGSAVYGPGWNKSVVGNATTTVTSIPVGSSGTIDYQLTDTINYRFGTINYSIGSTGMTYFSDDYSESIPNFLTANVYVASTGNLSCFVSNTAVLKYNIKNFL